MVKYKMISVHHFLKCSAACSVCVHVLSTRGQSVLTVKVFLQQGPDTFWELLTCKNPDEERLLMQVNSLTMLYCHVLNGCYCCGWP